MATLKIHDGADQYRIEIVGNFAGSLVHDLNQNWRKALSENIQRKVTVDISRLSGYDTSGCNLLRKMHQHGTTIAAGTPRSLIFLQEITAPPRRGPTLVRHAVSDKQGTNSSPAANAFAAGK